MNLPNKLTVSRFFITILFTILILSNYAYSNLLALIVFIVGMTTDFIDGRIARAQNLKTDFGALMDPLADKVMVCAAFVCFVARGWLGPYGAYFVILIISREFLITGLRILAGARGQILSADRLGKHKTAWQMITIIMVLIRNVTDEVFTSRDPVWLDGALQILTWSVYLTMAVTIALTLYSGFAYMVKNKQLWAENN
ncbi:CDP-diacylglycerol--glycerol-3-phosphate 3-phosphatidyltransferase [Kamptonema cortianum]|nr:CDP-diacylglycerol--glycerol-3-phosphate 3-phosphatidyltransferase [Kamptonema cortianum]MDL5046160.1 CDP-diacylglycerol--glycerol-3-phosphate 3-phosphatidyltransferase [Oscillatoria amoena NRMC-F 0135]